MTTSGSTSRGYSGYRGVANTAVTWTAEFRARARHWYDPADDATPSVVAAMKIAKRNDVMEPVQHEHDSSGVIEKNLRVWIGARWFVSRYDSIEAAGGVELRLNSARPDHYIP